MISLKYLISNTKASMPVTDPLMFKATDKGITIIKKSLNDFVLKYLSKPKNIQGNKEKANISGFNIPRIIKTGIKKFTRVSDIRLVLFGRL